MNTSLILTKVVEQALPALSGVHVTYNKQHNIFLSDSYTSAMGNTYYKGIRLSNRIIISYSLGQGYAHTFLNGISIYGFNGRDKKLIATRAFCCNVFSELKAKNICVNMITDYIQGEAKLSNASVSPSEISDFADKLVAEAMRNNPSRLLQ